MVEVIKGSGRNVTADNFFSSVTLARQLLVKKLSLLGTMQKNKTEIPPEFLPATSRSVNSSIFGHQDQLTLVLYVPKRNKAVILISSMHLDAQVSDRPDKKPQIVLDYNATKGGVDTLDQMVSTFSTKRMTRRWPVVLFYNSLDVSAVNALVIWTHLNPTWNQGKLQRRRLFLKELGMSLVKDHLQARLALPNLSLELQAIVKQAVADVTRTSASDDDTILYHAVQNSDSTDETSGKRKRGRCKHCDHSSDKKTRAVCETCGTFICTAHSTLLCMDCHPH